MERLNREVLTILYNNNAYWGRCGGSGKRSGVIFETLFDRLQTNYPETGWTEDVLKMILIRGLRRGIYKTRQVNLATCQVQVKVPALPTPTPFYANNAMAIENYSNRVYADIAPRLICIPECQVRQGSIYT